MINAAITGWGSYIPEAVLSNGDLEKLIDTNDEWIRSRTGIGERRIVGPGETTSSMGLIAARRALDEASLSARDLDLVICATTTPDYLLPSSACLIQQQLGADRAGAFDLNSACSGFVYGMSIASQFIQAGMYRRILVISSEALSRFVNFQDRSTCILFGDGAAAVVVEATSQPNGVLSSVLGSRGDVDKMLVIEGGGCARPASVESVANKDHFVRMRGNEVFKMAVRNMVAASQNAIAKAGLTLDDIDAVIPHQANLRILTATQESLGFPAEKMFVNVDRFGNTGAASIPIALDEYLQCNPVGVGHHFLMVAFGGGLTWGACVLRWADIAAIRKERSHKQSA
jgi:3-oxoacyl-[acyl-carrier-protein] synthase-3